MKADPDTERHLFVEVRMPAGVTEEQTRMLFDCVPGMESCERKPNTGKCEQDTGENRHKVNLICFTELF